MLYKLTIPCLLSLCSLASHAGQPVLASTAALVLETQTGKILYSKNAQESRPMASLTKMTTAMVVLDSQSEELGEVITITDEDVDYYKKSTSHLMVGSVFTRDQLLHLAMMASDNRAAHALARTYPGGVTSFVQKMNQKSADLNLQATVFTDPTGLLETNVSTPSDIAKITLAASHYEQLRRYSTDQDEVITQGTTQTLLKNTNSIIRERQWPSVILSKTGYIQESGRCVAMLGSLADKNIIIVLMNSRSSLTRAKDIKTLQAWVTHPTLQVTSLNHRTVKPKPHKTKKA